VTARSCSRAGGQRQNALERLRRLRDLIVVYETCRQVPLTREARRGLRNKRYYYITERYVTTVWPFGICPHQTLPLATLFGSPRHGYRTCTDFGGLEGGWFKCCFQCAGGQRRTCSLLRRRSIFRSRHDHCQCVSRFLMTTRGGTSERIA
jgi:hypothetical protein